MPFIGQEPLTGAYHVLDSITASATATYNLQLNSGAFSPASANQLLVSLNGVIQKPGSSFTISGSQITFSSALTSSDSIDFIIALGDVLSVGTPTDGTVTTNKIANDAVTGAKIENNPTIAGNLGVNGITTSTGAIVASAGVAVGGTGSANTLDDFEKGTFSATMSFTTANGSHAFNRNVCSYVKIGRMVHLQMFVELSSKSGASGDARLSNLPFAPQNTTNGFQFGFVAFNNMTNGGAFDSDKASMFVQLNPGDGTMRMYVGNGSGGITQLDASHMTDTTQFRVNITYETDS